MTALQESCEGKAAVKDTSRAKQARQKGRDDDDNQ